MAKITDPELFQIGEDDLFPRLSDIELDKYLLETSPHHPNENMRWLYDRLLRTRASRASRNNQGD